MGKIVILSIFLIGEVLRRIIRLNIWPESEVNRFYGEGEIRIIVSGFSEYVWGVG